MDKYSFFSAAFFTVLLIIASRASLSTGLAAYEANKVLHCTRDIDCQLKCPKGGFCNNNGTCHCITPQKKSGEKSTKAGPRCSRDVDCAFRCPKGGLCSNNGTCICWSAHKRSTEAIFASGCVHHTDCANSTPNGCKPMSCLKGTCLYECDA